MREDWRSIHAELKVKNQEVERDATVVTIRNSQTRWMTRSFVFDAAIAVIPCNIASFMIKESIESAKCYV